MERSVFENEETRVEIVTKNEEVTWPEIMKSAINAIWGHGYISERLQELCEEMHTELDNK